MADVVCKRSMDCKCPECEAANAAFSVEDLKQFSSNITYDDPTGEEMAEEPKPKPKPKPKAKPKAKPPAADKPWLKKKGAKPAAAAATADPFPDAVVEVAAPPPPKVEVQPTASNPPAPPSATDPSPPPAGTPPGEAPPEDAPTFDGPLSERLVSKDWKCRQAALEELAKAFRAASEGDELLQEYGDQLPKMAADSNAACLEAGLDACLAYAETAGSAAAEQVAAKVAHKIIAKGFSGRPSAIKKSEEALLKFMEVSPPEQVALALLEGLKDKKPKVPPACMATLIEGVRSCGAGKMPLKEMKAEFNSMLTHKVTDVRSKALTLLAEIVRRVGQAPLQSVVDEMRSAQQSEFEKELEALGPLKTAEEGGGGGGAGINPRDLLTEVDLIPKLAKTEFKAKMAETKWSFKVEGMQIAIGIIGPIAKLAPGDYGDLVSLFKGLGGHSHVQVASNAFKLLGLLGEGLGQSYSPYARGVLRAMLEKLRDKKCVPVVQESLTRLYGNGVTLDSCCDDFVTAVEKGNKASQVASFNWVLSCFSEDSPTLDSGTYATLAALAVTYLGDSDPKVREAAFAFTVAVVQTAKKVSSDKGSGALRAVQELSTSNIKMLDKVTKAIASDAGGAAPSSSGSKPPTGGGKTAPRVKRPSMNASADSDDKASKPTHRRLASGKRAPSASASKGRSGATPKSGDSKPPASASSSGKSGGAAASLEVIPDFTPDGPGGEAALSDMGLDWEGFIGPGLKSSKWQEKVAALDAIAKGVKGGSVSGSGSFAAVVSVLHTNTKGLKDSNFNIMTAAANVVVAMMQKGSQLEVDKAALGCVLIAFTAKLSDRKLKEPAGTLLTSTAENISPALAFSVVRQVLPSMKAPPARESVLDWLISCAEEYGSASMSVRDLVQLAVSEADHSNIKVRGAAIKLLGAIYHEMGPPVKALIPDGMKAATKTQLDEEFQKRGFDPAVGKARAAKSSGSAGGGSSGGGGGLPRSDLLAMLPDDCLKKMSDTSHKKAWEGRKASLEAVIAACDKSANYIEASRAILELLKALKERLSDSQSNLKPLAATAIGAVMCSVPAESTPKLCKAIAEPLLSCCGDNKKSMRDAALAALDKVCSSPEVLEAMFQQVAVALTKSVGRQELLEWVTKHTEGLSSTDQSSVLGKPLVDCLQDKAAATRGAAEDLGCALMQRGCLTPAGMNHASRNLQPAAQRTIKPSLDRMFAAALSGGASEDSSPRLAAEDTEKAPKPQARERSEGSSAGSSSARGHVRRPSGRQAPRAQAQPAESAAAADASPTGPAMVSNNLKGKREKEEKHKRWIVSSDAPLDDAAKLLKAQWSPLLSSAAAVKLFPNKIGSMECGNDGMVVLASALEENPATFMESLDLVFKWFSLRLCEKGNVQALQKLLALIEVVLETGQAEGITMSDYEAELLLPVVLEKTGQSKERFRTAMIRIMQKCEALYSSPAKYCAQVLSVVLGSKNNRSRAVCLEELARMVEKEGLSCLGKKGVKELARQVEAREADVRAGALTAITAVYFRLDGDLNKLYKVTGEISPKATGLIEEKVKAAGKGRPKAIPSATAGAPLARKRPSTAAPSGLQPPAATPSKSKPQPDEEEHIPEERQASLEGLQLEPGGDASSIGSPPGSPADDVSYGTDGPFKFNDADVEISMSPQCRGGELPLETPISLAAFGAMPEPSSAPVAMEDQPEPTVTSQASLALLEMLDQVLALPQPVSKEDPTVKEVCSTIYELAKEDGPTAFTGAPGPITMRLMDCVTASLSGGIAGPTGPIDMNLLLMILGPLVAISRLRATMLSPRAMIHLLKVDCKALVDERLSSPANETAARALNKVAISAVENSPSHFAAAALLDLLRRALPTSKRDQEFTPKVARIFVKLLVRVMKKESDLAKPFSSMQLSTILPPLAAFYAEHDATSANDEGPHEQVRSAVHGLWSELCQANGPRALLTAMEECGVGSSESLHAMTARHEAVAAPTISRSSMSQAEMDAEVSRLIQAIGAPGTLGKGDPIMAIGELHTFAKQHPEVNLADHLAHLSAPFQSFIKAQLDILESSGQSRLAENDPVDKKEKLEYLWKKLKSGDDKGLPVKGEPAAGYTPSSASDTTAKAPLQQNTLQNIRDKLANAGGGTASGSSSTSYTARATARLPSSSIGSGIGGGGTKGSSTASSLKERLARVKAGQRRT